MLAKINKLSNKQVALLIFLVGLVVFCTGLFNPFQGDDILQIVQNVPVHSLWNIKLFFEGSTFYNGQGLVPLTGSYYRPLQTTFFSLIYTVFGAHSWPFHLLQLMLYIASAFILYLVLRYFFNTVLALALAIIFLIHPLNSQVVYAIPQLDDVLFFFFGILAIWFLLRFKSVSSLWLVALGLFLSLLSKETAVVFVIMALVYLSWFNRQRLLAFIGIMVLPTAAYLALRINAIGLTNHPSTSPIDNLNLVGRLYSAPSIMLLYLSKFIFPWKLATNYFWANTSFSIQHVLLPLIIDLIIVALVVYLAFVIRKKASRKYYFTYLLFAVWAFLGLIPYLQIIPLDQTASEPWFYFSMVGWLGMIGVIIKVFLKHINPTWLLTAAIILITIFGFRTFMRGIDWNNKYHLDRLDIAASKQDYVAYNDIAYDLINQHKYAEATTYVKQSITIFPTIGNYNNLGYIYMDTGKIAAAKVAFNTGTRYGKFVNTYESLAAITLVNGNVKSNQLFFKQAFRYFPQDGKIWFYQALFDSEHNDNSGAVVALNHAIYYGYSVNPNLYKVIANNQPAVIHTNLGTIYIK